MQCSECGEQEWAYLGLTEDVKNRLECLQCGHVWEHGGALPSRSRTGATKHFCPVCPAVYSDHTAPILTIGSPSSQGHRCDRTGSWKAGVRFGRDDRALDRRLAEVSDEQLADWPLVRELKAERAGR